MNSKKIQFFTAFLLAAFVARAQEATTASGGDASGSGGSTSYSVGQVVYIATAGSTGGEIQGVQQPYEIMATGISDPAYAVTLAAFPNPATGLLNLKVDNFSDQNLFYSLFDIQGKLLESKAISSQQTQLDLGNLAAAEYLLTVAQNNKTIRSFKIIKK